MARYNEQMQELANQYNDNQNDGEPIQVPLNFTADVHEHELGEG